MARLRLSFVPGLIAAASVAALFALVGADGALAGSCNPGSTNFNFTLGTLNTCDGSSTSLTGTGPNGLYVELTGTAANTRPVIGYASGGSGAGVIGVVGSTNSVGGYSAGVAGGLNPSNPAADSAAVRGVTYSTSTNGAGVWGNHPFGSGSAPGVLGDTASTSANAVGVQGTIIPSSAGSKSVAVLGRNNSTSSAGFGLWGSQAGAGYGVYGTTPSGIGVDGESPSGYGVVGKSTTGWAGYFLGDVTITGTLFKGAGAFKIDDPTAPSRRYLQHSFVESPDMMDIYNGIVTTDGRGYARVTMPHWFQALNRTFRYQLTIVGKRGWNARVVKEIAGNRFTIQTDAPNVRVSWQVTGIRHDPYANAHRIQVVVPKPAAEQGSFMHPRQYGQPASKGAFVPSNG